MKKIVIGMSLTLGLLLSGCSESAENKAKTEFNQAMLSIKPETFIKEWTETKDMFEEKSMFEEKYIFSRSSKSFENSSTNSSGLL